ncbi:MAG: precorrin-3B synthase [Mesorhizobium sp.]
MNAGMIRGACPTLSAPMATGDGLLIRLVPARGGFTPPQLVGLAEAAFRYGNSILEVTARGSLQIRGLEDHTVLPLAAEIDALGIVVRTGVPVETGPLAGLDPSETADPRPLADTIRSALEATDLPERLGPKVSVVVDGGGRLHLDGIIADVRLTATGCGRNIAWNLAIGGTAETAMPIASLHEEKAGKAAVLVLAAIAEIGRQGRARDLDPQLIRTLINDASPEDNGSFPPGRAEGDPRCKPTSTPEEGRAIAYGILPPPLTPPDKGEGNTGAALPSETIDVLAPSGAATESPSPLWGGVRGGCEIPVSGEIERGSEAKGSSAQPIGIFDLSDGTAALGVGLPFGQIEASRLAGFCRLAEDHGVTEVRLAPGRAILMLAEPSACLDLQNVAPRYALIVDPADARLGIAACPGSPACASGHIAARSLAEQLAALGNGLFDQSLTVHVSGCAKGCACPGASDLTFVGNPESIDLVVGGRASGLADVRLPHGEIRHGFARLGGLYRQARRRGESVNSCFSRLGALRVAATFQGQS